MTCKGGRSSENDCYAKTQEHPGPRLRAADVKTGRPKHGSVEHVTPITRGRSGLTNVLESLCRCGRWATSVWDESALCNPHSDASGLRTEPPARPVRRVR